jgi:hypothetical protein
MVWELLYKYGSNPEKQPWWGGTPEFSTGNKGVGRLVLSLFVKRVKIAFLF